MTRKAALVTGASSGIGTAIVKVLADAGYSVMAAGRDPDRTRRIRDLGPGVTTWTGDIASRQKCVELVADCASKFDRLDLLVNNAGIYRVANAETTSDEIWSQTMAVNLDAPFFLSRAALPHLRKTKGVILNIASDWGLVGGRDSVAYCASKGAVVLMTRAMAIDHAGEGIRVNAICPGDVDTPMLYAEGATRGLGPEDTLREARAANPTGKVTTPEEVAALAAYLASDAAAQINGAAIPIGADTSI